MNMLPSFLSFPTFYFLPPQRQVCPCQAPSFFSALYPPFSFAVLLIHPLSMQHALCSLISLFPSFLPNFSWVLLILPFVCLPFSCHSYSLWRLGAHKNEQESPSTWFISTAMTNAGGTTELFHELPVLFIYHSQFSNVQRSMKHEYKISQFLLK